MGTRKGAQVLKRVQGESVLNGRAALLTMVYLMPGGYNKVTLLSRICYTSLYHPPLTRAALC